MPNGLPSITGMAKALIVDDEESVLHTVGLLLKSEGHEVTATKDGAAAETLLKQEKFDLLITDIRMAPVDGMRLLQTAHSLSPVVPTIVISAYSSEAVRQQSYSLGCVSYITKPFRIQDVIAAVNKALAPQAAN